MIEAFGLDTKVDNYNYLNITHYKLEDDYKRALFYEEVSTVDNYEFSYGALNTIKYIFNELTPILETTYGSKSG